MKTFSRLMPGPAEPGVLPETEQELRHAFLSEVGRIPGGERLNRCIQCGTCSGSCPVTYAMDYSPRLVIAMFRAGAIEALLRSRTIWICASCYSLYGALPGGYQDHRSALRLETDCDRERDPARQVPGLCIVRNLRRHGAPPRAQPRDRSATALLPQDRSPPIAEDGRRRPGAVSARADAAHAAQDPRPRRPAPDHRQSRGPSIGRRSR